MGAEAFHKSLQYGGVRLWTLVLQGESLYNLTR